LKNLEARVMSTNSRVLVTGDLNAGKSTFVNALLRRGGVDEEGWPTGVLPVDQQPLTGRFVEVFGDQFLGGDGRGGPGGGGRERVHIVKGKEAD
jgi:mitofusin